MRSLPILWRMAEDLRRLAMPSSPLFELHPWTTSYRWTPTSFHQLNRMLDEDLAKFKKDSYEVNINVAEFKPEELTVKIVDDNVVVVEGKSEQQQDNGFISRHFVRRFALPKGYVADNAISSLSADGVLTVNVPKPPELEEKVREIPIQQMESNASLKDKGESES